MKLKVSLEVSIPQLTALVDEVRLGARLMALSFDALTAAITALAEDLNTTLDAELTEIATALTNAGLNPEAQAMIDLQAARIIAFSDALKMRISAIIP